MLEKTQLWGSDQMRVSFSGAYGFTGTIDGPERDSDDSVEGSGLRALGIGSGMKQ